MKRVLSMVLTLVLLIGMVPVVARAASKATITTQPKSVSVDKGKQPRSPSKPPVTA